MDAQNEGTIGFEYIAAELRAHGWEINQEAVRWLNQIIPIAAG